jgi:hypothetical protein
MDVTYTHCAGLGVHKKTVVACASNLGPKAPSRLRFTLLVVNARHIHFGSYGLSRTAGEGAAFQGQGLGAARRPPNPANSDFPCPLPLRFAPETGVTGGGKGSQEQVFISGCPSSS